MTGYAVILIGKLLDFAQPSLFEVTISFTKPEKRNTKVYITIAVAYTLGVSFSLPEQLHR